MTLSFPYIGLECELRGCSEWAVQSKIDSLESYYGKNIWPRGIKFISKEIKSEVLEEVSGAWKTSEAEDVLKMEYRRCGQEEKEVKEKSF